MPYQKFRARARVTPGTTPRQLFDLFRGMIEPLHDAHTSLSAPSLHARFFGLRPEAERFLRGGLEHFLQVEIPRLTGVTEKGYLRGPLRKWCHCAAHDSIGSRRIGNCNSTRPGPQPAFRQTVLRLGPDFRLAVICPSIGP